MLWAAPAPSTALAVASSAAPDKRDLELAYLRGHVAGLNCRSENPIPPQVATQLAHQAVRHDPVTETVEGTAAATQAAPPHAAEPRERGRPMASSESPRLPPEPGHRRTPPPPQGGTESATGARLMIVPAAMAMRSYRTPDRYDEPRSERRASSGPAYDYHGNDRADARHGDRHNRGPPSRALNEGPTGSGTTPTDVGANPPARRRRGVYTMMR